MPGSAGRFRCWSADLGRSHRGRASMAGRSQAELGNEEVALCRSGELRWRLTPLQSCLQFSQVLIHHAENFVVINIAQAMTVMGFSQKTKVCHQLTKANIRRMSPEVSQHSQCFVLLIVCHGT